MVLNPQVAPTEKCTSCDPPPPTLSNKVIRNLGMQFCSMNAEDLLDENLSQGGGKMEPVARKRNKNASTKDGKSGQGSSKTGRKNGHGSSKAGGSVPKKP